MPVALPKLVWTASPNFSARGAAVDLIVIHDCEGSYTGAVGWFGQEKSQVSAHLVLKEDGTEATQMVDFGQKAWHARVFNSRSIGIEMGGFAARGFPDAEWQTAANVTAYLLRAFALPCAWSRHGAGAGFTSHFDLGVAGGGHHDPCPTDDPKWTSFVDRVRFAYENADNPETWGRGTPHAIPPVPSPVQTATMAPEDVQRALNKAGARPQLLVDGEIGFRTQTALGLFQSRNGLFVSGHLNDATIRALTQVLAGG